MSKGGISAVSRIPEARNWLRNSVRDQPRGQCHLSIEDRYQER